MNVGPRRKLVVEPLCSSNESQTKSSREPPCTSDVGPRRKLVVEPLSTESTTTEDLKTKEYIELLERKLQAEPSAESFQSHDDLRREMPFENAFTRYTNERGYERGWYLINKLTSLNIKFIRASFNFDMKECARLESEMRTVWHTLSCRTQNLPEGS